MAKMEIFLKYLPYIMMLILAIPGFISLRNQLRLGDANVAEKYQNIADKATTEVARLQIKVASLDGSIVALLVRLKELQEEVNNLEAWALKLCGQVTMMGAVPVKRPENKP